MKRTNTSGTSSSEGKHATLAVGLVTVLCAAMLVIGCKDRASESADKPTPAATSISEATLQAGGTTPTPSVSPSAIPTTRATVTPTPDAPPSPGSTPEAAFEYGSEVPPDDRALIQAGVSIIQRYLDASVGIDEPKVTVYVYADLENVDAPWESIASKTGIPEAALIQGIQVFVGETFPEAIFINVAAQSWKNLPTLEKIRLAAHEYVHTIQLDLMGKGKTQHFFNSVGQPETTAGPLWLVEGSAEYLSWKALQSTGLLSLDRFLSTTTARRLDVRTLSSFGGFQSEGLDAYVSSLRAVAYLVGDEGDQLVIDYFRALGDGDSWEFAFVQAFGRDIDAFYSAFDSVDGR